MAAQYRANRAALEASLAEEKSRLLKARHELASAEQIRSKLADTLPHYRAQDEAFDKLARDGFAGPLMASDKKRERIEKEQELKTQDHLIASARAGISQSERKLAQIDSDYRRQLHAERNEVQGQSDRLAQELAKQSHRQTLLELRANQDSVVKELATHSPGTVVQPGTVLLTLVPKNDILRAEVWVSNEDIGFVRPGQAVKLKFAAFPFQKYGMVEGTVEHVGADSADSPGDPAETGRNDAPAQKPATGIQGTGRAQGHASGDRWPALCPRRGHADTCRNSPWAANRRRVSALASTQGLARVGQGTLNAGPGGRFRHGAHVPEQAASVQRMPKRGDRRWRSSGQETRLRGLSRNAS
jgi:hypothetical protein